LLLLNLKSGTVPFMLIALMLIYRKCCAYDIHMPGSDLIFDCPSIVYLAPPHVVSFAYVLNLVQSVDKSLCSIFFGAAMFLFSYNSLHGMI
jgi:hypothetical protein